MRKLAIVLAATTVMVFAGALAWKADATTLTGVGGLPTVKKAIHLWNMFAALADLVDVPATAGFGAAGGTGAVACAAGGGEMTRSLNAYG